MPFKFRVSTLEAGKNDYPRGKHYGNWAGLSDVERKLISDNIKYGVNVFGIIGTMVHWQWVIQNQRTVPLASCTNSLIEDHHGGSNVENITLATLAETSIALNPVSASVSNPDKVVVHDDDPPNDTDVTTEAISDPVVDQSHLSNGSNTDQFSGNAWRAQTFTPSVNHTIKGVRLMLERITAGTITVSIRATDGGKPTGADLCSGSVDSSFFNRYNVYDISLGAGVALVSGTTYAIVVRATTTTNWQNSGNEYAGGQRCYSSNAGVNWTADSTKDFLFEEYGDNSNDVPCCPYPSAVGDGLYVGKATKFSYVCLWLNQQGVGTYSVTWKYWNGTTWAVLALLSDGDWTASWKRPGRWTVSFNPPEDWATFSIDGSDIYWVKAEITDYTSQTKQPLLGRVWVGAY
jgi:hypothetical protein